MGLREKFELFLNKSFAWDVHTGRDIVCMKCRRLIKNGDRLDKCCFELGFEIDPETVVIDKTTGKVTQCSPRKGDN